MSSEETYPAHWKHATIHLNPETGEMHSGGDHSVRSWIESQIPYRYRLEEAEALMRQPENIIDGLVAAFNRYGHHDHDCPRHDVFDGADECECGFNAALSAALGRETPPIKPPLARQRANG